MKQGRTAADKNTSRYFNFMAEKISSSASAGAGDLP